MDATREYYKLLGDGDPDTVASTEGWPGARRRPDPVADWPADRLHELAAEHPELVDEIVRRRPGDVVQL